MNLGIMGAGRGHTARASVVVGLGVIALLSCSESPRSNPRPATRATAESHLVRPTHGNSAMHGGSPTVRKPYSRRPDNPATSNNESNDQPVGHYGTETVTVFSHESGNHYTLDADIDGVEVSRIYFPKGGWVDFPDCELEPDGEASCTDEEGRLWDVEADTPDPTVDGVENDSSDDE